MRRGMGRDRHVHHAASLVRQDDQHEEESTRGGRYDEEIGSHNLANVIREKRAPILGGRPSVPGHVLRHGRLTHGDSQFQELTVNTRRAPQRVGLRHRANQLADVRRNAWSTHSASALPRPEESEAATVPGHDRLGLDDHESRPAIRPRRAISRPTAVGLHGEAVSAESEIVPGPGVDRVAPESQAAGSSERGMTCVG